MAEEIVFILDVLTPGPYKMLVLNHFFTSYVEKCSIYKNATTLIWQRFIHSLYWFFQLYW